MIWFLDFRPYIHTGTVLYILKAQILPIKTNYDMSYLLRNLTDAISIIMRNIVDESSCILVHPNLIDYFSES